MSIEQALAENTSAIRELIAALSNGIPTTGAQVDAVVAEAPASKAEAKKPAAAEKPAPSSGTTSESAASSAPSASGEPPVKLDYDAIKKPFLALVNKKGRDAAAKLLANFGVDAGKGGKLSDIPTEKYADVLAAIETAEA
ncbi:MAG: hypothetical protein KKH74_06330 [Gammaproteobacteria bacterium]|nr:hypothetical protein [Gammaproteobacteria bacterium]MBU1732260.1 hypothetical protein [Gammaproteobacteria bacterium]MBU1893830.1 hypothetical protein [Gammaproteobacteria bacterium]